MKITPIFQTCLDILLPQKCPLCKNLVKSEHEKFFPLCLACHNKISYLAYEEKRKNYRILSLARYKDEIRDLIHSLKYDQNKLLAKYFALQMQDQFGSYVNWESIDAIVPVPMHRDKKFKRGYNQSEIISKYLSRFMHKSCYPNMLIKSKETESQASLDKLNRLTNLIDTIKVNSFFKKKNIKHVILIDDICTTGTTIGECINALSNKYPELEITVMVIART